MHLRTSIWWMMRKCGLGPLLLRFHPKSGLLRLGWFASFRKRSPIDCLHQPLPWWTYPCIFFLKERDLSDLRVLEVGCGHSTLWLGQRVREIISLETNSDWANRIGQRMTKNGQIINLKSWEDIPIEWLSASGLFDFLIIDAGNRIRIFDELRHLLSPRGIALWDNTNGPDWTVIAEQNAQFGFRSISFTGLVPQELCLSRTTIWLFAF